MLENPHLKIYNVALELLISILMHRLLFLIKAKNVIYKTMAENKTTKKIILMHLKFPILLTSIDSQNKMKILKFIWTQFMVT